LTSFFFIWSSPSRVILLLNGVCIFSFTCQHKCKLKLLPVYISFIVCPFGGYLDPDQCSEITRIIVHERNWWLHSVHGFIGSFDALWSEWSWIINPELELAFQRNAPSINTSKSCFESNLCPIPGVLHQDVMGRDMWMESLHPTAGEKKHILLITYMLLN